MSKTKTPERLTIMWRVVLDGDGQFYAERCVVDESAILHTDRRNGAGIPMSSELARMDMERVSRRLWERAWTKGRAATYADIDASRLVARDEAESAIPPEDRVSGRLAEIDASIAARAKGVELLPDAESVRGLVQMPDGTRVREETLPEDQRFKASPIVTRQAVEAQLADMQLMRDALTGETSNAQDEWREASESRKRATDQAVERARKLRIEAQALANTVTNDLMGSPWSQA